MDASIPTAGRACVVTGGARGIGRAIAERLVAAGHAVVVTDVDAEAVRLTAAELGAVGIEHDVRDPQAHRRVATAARDLGSLVAWFNNAGVGDDGMLVDLADEQVRRLVEVNLLGCLWGMRAALAVFAEQGGGGDVVNTASLSGLGPVPGYSAYAATKAAIVSATMSVAAEAPRGVGVHALCPEGVRTDLLAGQDPQGLGARLVHSGARILTAEETAAAAVGLVGSRRVVRTLPAWRGGLVRAGSFAPSAARPVTALLAARGARLLERRGREGIGGHGPSADEP